jgi:multimeric flavodoxin WrbA
MNNYMDSGMKVIAINGSPRREGNTALALAEMGGIFSGAGIEMEILHVGDKLIRGCMACGACGRNKNERCAFGSEGDPVNGAIAKMKAADGIILGSPVHFAGIGGAMKSFCDRVFYVAGANGGLFAGKVGTSVVAVRRTGGSATWGGLNYYLALSNMSIAGSSYWGVVHGALPGEAAADAEGIQTVRNAARNMARMMADKAASSASAPPEFERGARTNFIR